MCSANRRKSFIFRTYFLESSIILEVRFFSSISVQFFRKVCRLKGTIGIYQIIKGNKYVIYELYFTIHHRHHHRYPPRRLQQHSVHRPTFLAKNPERLVSLQSKSSQVALPFPGLALRQRS